MSAFRPTGSGRPESARAGRGPAAPGSVDIRRGSPGAGRRAVLRGGAGALGVALLSRGSWAQRNELLRIGMAAPNTTMDPHLQSNAPNNAVASHIFDALVTNDEQSRSQPGLAESWRVVDDTHWEFRLRRGVTFTDGVPFTAADAIASIKRA